MPVSQGFGDTKGNAGMGDTTICSASLPLRTISIWLSPSNFYPSDT
ncbi:hypothetical protein [Vibrio mediterranei]